MRKFKVSLLYFALVFLAGFVMGMVRVTFLVPSLGVRVAELLEMPLMLLAIVFSARFLVRRSAPLSRFDTIYIGLSAFLITAVAELSFAALLQGQSPAQYIASRDPVSGSVYLGMLLLFVAMPTIQRNR